MPVRHPLPTLWLMTDERMGDGLWGAIADLPKGSGIVFRHIATPPRHRAALLTRISAIARRRRIVVVDALASDWLAMRQAHSAREAVAARRAGADLIFVSPVYPTRTHPGARALGPLRAGRIARSTRIPAIALGGMTQARFKRMQKMGFVGWAAIDGLTPAQKRKAVPT